MKNFENELITMFVEGNDNFYGEGERVEIEFENDEYNNKENYDDEFVNGFRDLKKRLKKGNIEIKVEDDNIVYNFELKGEDILMWFIEGKEWF